MKYKNQIFDRSFSIREQNVCIHESKINFDNESDLKMNVSEMKEVEDETGFRYGYLQSSVQEKTSNQ